MRLVLRGIGILLILVFLAALPPALVLHDAGKILFSRERLGRLTEESLLNSTLLVRGIYQGAFSNLIEEQADRLHRIDLSGVQMRAGDVEALAQVAEGLIPMGLLDATMQKSLDAVFDWLDGDQTYPALVVDTRPFTDRMGAQLPVVVDTLMAALPPCSKEELREILRRQHHRVSGRMKPCLPPEPFREPVKSAILKDLLDRLAETPPTVNVAARLEKEIAPGRAVAAKKSLRAVRDVSRSGWAVVLLPYLIAIPLVARSRAEALKWAGWPLFVAGGMCLMGAFVFLLFGDRLPSAMMQGLGMHAANPGPLMAAASGLATVFTAVGGDLLRQAGWMMILGGGAWIAAGRLAGRPSSRAFQKEGGRERSTKGQTTGEEE